MGFYLSDSHVERAIDGIVALMELNDHELDPGEARGALNASLRNLSRRAGRIQLATGAGGCRITRVTITCSDESDEPGLIRDPIDVGPERRGSIAWGGSECFTIGRCTVSYEYECRPKAIAE